MSHEIGILYNKVLRMLKDSHLSVRELEAITGEDRGWIYKFMAGEINDPGSKRLEGVEREMKKYNRAKRAKK